MLTHKKLCFVSASIFAVTLFLTTTPADAMTPIELRAKYDTALKTGNKVNVLIVPGHDDDYSGTEYNEIRESDVVVSIGQYLYDFLKTDPRLNVTITRTQMGYTPLFKNYFETNRAQIQDFIAVSKKEHQVKISAGSIATSVSVPHNAALPEVALRLYGINKWANENNVDVTLHLHINDVGGREYGQPGQYTGFSVYIPENQYSNAGASAVVGESLLNELRINNQVSTYPAESRGLIEDQDLIAIGASDTVKNVATLIEYGYIYEPQFSNLDMRESVTKELARQTSTGLHKFFGNQRSLILAGISSSNISSATNSQTSANIKTTLGATKKLTKELKKGSTGNEVEFLQTILTQSGVYACGVTGTLGPCTETGLKAFQKKYRLTQTGTTGPLTRTKLNSLVAQ